MAEKVSSSNGLEQRPKLRFPGFDEPWKFCKAEDIFTNVVDKNHPTETVLTIIQGKGTLPREAAGRNIHYDNASLSGYKKVEKGDFIIHLRSFEGGLETANETGIVSPAYTILRPIDKVSTLFYDAYFHTDEFINHVLSKSVEGIRDGRQISYEAFKWLGIPYCDITEQEKISVFFEVLNARIDKQRQLVNSLKKYKRGLSSRAFDGKSCSITLGDFCIITMGQSPDSTSYNTKNIGLPLVQGNADMKGRKTCPQRFTSNPTKTCDEGAIILSVRAPVGTVGIADQKICLGRGVCSITCEDREYVYQYLLYHEDSWKNIEQGGTFTAISGDDIRRFPLYFPDEPERKKISSLLTVMDKRIATSTIILERLTECKSALLQQLFI